MLNLDPKEEKAIVAIFVVIAIVVVYLSNSAGNSDKTIEDIYPKQLQQYNERNRFKQNSNDLDQLDNQQFKEPIKRQKRYEEVPQYRDEDENFDNYL